MIVLDPENIGCGRKLPHTDLAALQDYIASHFPEAVKAEDSAIVPSDPTTKTRAISIDRTVRFCSNIKTFVRASIHHACNDLIVSRAKPFLASVSFGFSAADVGAREHFDVTHQVVAALSELDIRIGKLHSFIDGETNVTVCVEGAVQGAAQQIANEGAIFLSKPLGALKAIYLAEIGHRVHKLDDAVQAITTPSTAFLPIISEFAVGATDVSGFGLLHAIEQYCSWHHMRGKIELDKLPTIDPIVTSVEVECLDRGLGYEYRLIDTKNSQEGKRLEFLSEINGPLLIFVPKEHESFFRKSAPEEVTKIGEWGRD
jgi:hypothetical protein